MSVTKISFTRQAVLSLLAERGRLSGTTLGPMLATMQRTQPKRPVKQASKYLRDLARDGLAERLISPAGMPSTFAITDAGKAWLVNHRTEANSPPYDGGPDNDGWSA